MIFALQSSPGQTEGLKGRSKEWVDGWMRMKLMKLKKNGKNYAVFYFAGKRFFFVYIYEVFPWKLS